MPAVQTSPPLTSLQVVLLRELSHRGAYTRGSFVAHLASLGVQIDPSLVSLWSSGEVTMPAGALVALVDHVGLDAVRWLGERVPGVRVDIEDRDDVRRRPVTEAMLLLMSQAGSMCGELAAAMADGQVTPAEQADLHRRLQRVEDTLAGVRAALAPSATQPRQAVR